jgi:hypothetical protein
MDEQKAKRIAELNDLFRFNFFVPSMRPRPVPGQIVLTRGICALPQDTQIRIWFAVSEFKDFAEGDDPHCEHDFGSIPMDGVPVKIFWKIDYYADTSCALGSEDPSDPARSFRVLTIMLASEY